MSSTALPPAEEPVSHPRSGCGVAIVREGRILLLERLREPEAGSWGIPGGKVDWMERLEDAVRREALEETGLELGSIELLCVVDHFEEALQQHWISPVYLAEDTVGEPELREPEKHGGLRWFPLEVLPERVTVSTVAAVEAIARSRGSRRPDGADS
ncbi:NUDIX domain-containing protein [Plantibacter sp. T3]|uniref:NUDIX hydrolase n=1 Tax=unclassified Plantibacter TaxID=2624265 RepID=UPI00191692FC|nr:NUDIX domain-containing protein [Plantibacter sp. T3]